MDYIGLYHDLANMERRALSSAKPIYVSGNERLARELDEFLRELQTFMGVVVLRRW
jgi:hypothetical protein